MSVGACARNTRSDAASEVSPSRDALRGSSKVERSAVNRRPCGFDSLPRSHGERRVLSYSGASSKGKIPAWRAGDGGSTPPASTASRLVSPIEAVGRNRRATNSKCVVQLHGWALSVTLVLSFSGLGRPIVDRSTRVRFPSGPPSFAALLRLTVSSWSDQHRALSYKQGAPGAAPGATTARCARSASHSSVCSSAE